MDSSIIMPEIRVQNHIIKAFKGNIRHAGAELPLAQELVELAQLQLPPLGEECIAYPLAYRPMPHMARPSKNSPTLQIVKNVFEGVLKYCPRLMKSQKIPEIP
jgi:hypothetical protein